MGELSAIIGMLSAMDWNDCPQSQESARAPRANGLGKPGPFNQSRVKTVA
jgi:hypothetical protein